LNKFFHGVGFIGGGIVELDKRRTGAVFLQTFSAGPHIHRMRFGLIRSMLFAWLTPIALIGRRLSRRDCRRLSLGRLLGRGTRAGLASAGCWGAGCSRWDVCRFTHDSIFLVCWLKLNTVRRRLRKRHAIWFAGPKTSARCCMAISSGERIRWRSTCDSSQLGISRSGLAKFRAFKVENPVFWAFFLEFLENACARTSCIRLKINAKNL